MIKLLLNILFDEYGGLGITRASLQSAICEDTGDSSDDAVVKVRRLINRRGSQFCKITNWPFLRHDINFSITNSGGYVYSGADYLPTTFKKVVASYILDNDKHYPLDEVSIGESYGWANPDENEGRPDKFCITRIESGYWEIKFNKKPDQNYTVYLEIELQWTDLTDSDSETVMTKDYYDAFVHYCAIARFRQQGDSENYLLYKNEWDGNSPRDIPRHSILGQLLANLASPLRKKAAKVNMEKAGAGPEDVVSAKEMPDYKDDPVY